MNLRWESDMNWKNACVVRNVALLMVLACAVNGGRASYGESVERLMSDAARYEVRPLIDSSHNRIAWYVNEPPSDLRDGDDVNPCDVWRMRVRASLRFYRRKPDAVSLTVRLCANPTIRRKMDEGCFVEKILGAKSQDFSFREGMDDYCRPSSFILGVISSDVDRADNVTMCAYGKEPLHGGGTTIECALFFVGIETLTFAYRIGDGVDVKNVSIPMPNGSFPNGMSEVYSGTVSIYDAKHSVSVSVEHEHEMILSRQGKFLILTVRGPEASVDFPISMKNILSFQECLKARQNGLDCSWRAEVTENDRSPLFF